MKDNACTNCGHSHYDHGAWLEDRQEAVAASRPIGCRIAYCRCERFIAAPSAFQGEWRGFDFYDE